MHSVSEAGARAISLILADTAKSIGINYYEYLQKSLNDFPNLDNHQHPEILEQYLP